MKVDRATKWVSQNWNAIRLIAGALLWGVMLYLSSKFVGKEIYWRNYREIDSRLDALDSDMCVVSDRMKFKRHKPKKSKISGEEESEE